MPGPEDVRIVPAPLALRGEMTEIARGTVAAHNARQPFAFPQDRCAEAHEREPPQGRIVRPDNELTMLHHAANGNPPASIP